MKVGPLMFQWACLVCVCRSMQSASRALSNSTTLARVASARSFFVLNMTRLLSHDGSSGRWRAGLGFQKGQQVLVDLSVHEMRSGLKWHEETFSGCNGPSVYG